MDDLTKEALERETPDLADPADVEEPDAYDAGLLGDYGGGDVEWWQDYIRAELGRAHEFYAAQFRSQAAEITALRGERDTARAESSETIARWCIRMADVRAASGVGVKPMLDELPDAIRARFQALEDKLKTAVGALETAKSLMMSGGCWTNQAGYRTDEALWIDEALSSIQKEPGNG